MKKILLLLIVGMCIKLSAQERVSNLKFNPQLYWQSLSKNETNANNKRSLIKEQYLYLPDTLSLPFVDDFSKNHFKDPIPGTPIDTINRSIELGDQVMTFLVTDTSWDYSFDVGTQMEEKTPKAPSLSLILNDDIGNPKIPTNTVYQWPSYQKYTSWDSTTGQALDSVTVYPDTVKVLSYSEFILVPNLDKTRLWVDNQVFVNDDFPDSLNKLSYGVATFDGLNEFGTPYDPNGRPLDGQPADTLTSMPINLSGFQPSDSVFLTIWYQAQGLGDNPNIGDSLILEFKINDTTWIEQAGAEGYDGFVDKAFYPFHIHIENPFYLQNGFQFRLRNYATITGNNDHWNIDYVYLDDDRGKQDTSIRDLSVLYPPTNFLSNYTSMPYDQFVGFEQSELASTVKYNFRNNRKSADDFSYFLKVEQPIGNEIYLSRELTITSIDAESNEDSRSTPIDSIPFDQITTGDSVVVRLSSLMNVDPGSLTEENDTVYRDVQFFNYLAYDDGTAEKAYGLENSGLKKFAYRFRLNQPDTLRAVMFHWTQINHNLNILGRDFTFTVWKNIDLDNDGEGEDTLYFSDDRRFIYAPEKNGFSTIVLDTPIVVDGEFYVGWQQTFGENTQVGLDVNNNANQHMYYYAQSAWFGSVIKAAPMIRPVFGGVVQYPNTAVEGLNETQSLAIYPNPTNSALFIKHLIPEHDYEVAVYDLQGSRITKKPLAGNQVETARIKPGIYLLVVTNLTNRTSEHFRFVKM